MGIGTSASIVSFIPALFSLAIDRLKYSHMYSTMGLLGVFIAAGQAPLSVGHVIPVVLITVTTTGLYIFNDVFDLEIDRIAHPERALPRGTLTVRQALIAAVVLMVAGTTLAFLLDVTSGVFVGTIGLLGILYSAPPVRLRRFPVVPSMVIGLFVFLSFLAGASFSHAPVTGRFVFGALLLWALFLCCSMAKDLGQEEGDAADGVRTLPTILGAERAFLLTAPIVCSSFLFAILFVLLFGLHWILLVSTVVLSSIEVLTLREFWRNRTTSDRETWYVRSFMVFVVLQVSLLMGAL